MMDLTKIPTCQIVKELANREGVKEHIVDFEEAVTLEINGERILATTGPCILFYVYD